MRKLSAILRPCFLLLGLLLAAVFPALPVRTQAAGFSGGDGSPGNPYIITTPEQFNAIRNDLSAHYILGADIDLSVYGAGEGWQPVGSSESPFTGSLDGEGYTIYGLYINRPTTDYVGLFGCTGSGSEIRNLNLSGVNVTGNSYVGSLVGLNQGVITGCTAGGTVTGRYDAGGLVGRNSLSGSSITGSYVNCNHNHPYNGWFALPL